MIFQTMDPELVLKALEGHENVIKPAVESRDRFFRNLSCPTCKSDVMPVVDPERPLYLTGDLLPNYLAQCKCCGLRFEPYTGIQLSP